jgi:hypothetical protein
MFKNLLLVCLLSCSGRVLCQDLTNYDAKNIPSLLKIRASAVVRNMTTILDLREPENVIYTVREATTILNKNGDRKAALFLNYDKNTVIKRVKGMILNAFGQPQTKFSLSDFRDESAADNSSLFSDERVRYYIPSVNEYPYTIIYEYEVRYKQNLVTPDWYANRYPDVSVEKTVFTFLARPEDKIRVKPYNYNGTTEVVKSEKLYSETRMVSSLPAFKYEPYSPDEGSYLTYIKIAPEKFRYYGHKGSYANWKDLGKWVYDDLIKDRQQLSPAVAEEIKNLVKDIRDEKDKIRKIYAYVQQKTRYISVQIGLGGYQPFAAMDVQRLSYGDCKALVNYTQSLLKVAGIRSDYCVVSAGSFKQNPDPEFASMNQFNHIILCVPLENDTTWLECTSQKTPFGYLGSFTDDRMVWSCTENGGKLIKTPVLTTSGNLSQRKASLTLDIDGNIRGRMQTIYSGSRYDDNEQMVHKPYPKQLKLLKETYDVDNIDFSSVKLEQKKDISPVITEDLELSISRYAPETGSRAYLIPNIFNKATIIPELKNRTLPVYINRGYTDEDDITYTLPENQSVELKSEDKVIRSEFGSYAMTIRITGNKLVYHRKFILNNGTYPPQSYIGLTAFFNEASSYDNAKIILKTIKTSG